jgi:AraC family transcriptional regulator
MVKEPHITTLQSTTIVGKHITTTLAENRTRELWQSFRKREKEVQSRSNDWLYSVQTYDESQGQFTPNSPYDHWAGVEVSNPSSIPAKMEHITVPEGLYAVFIHRGTIKTFAQTMQAIYSQWIPQSDYLLDNRPHLQVMKEKYFGPLDPRSEEEVWLPIIPKR